MADDVVLPGTGDTVAADEIAGKKHQRIKMQWGPDGTANDTDVASGKPLPVQLRDSDGTDVALSGKVGGLTESAPGTDTASSGLNGRLQRIAQRITSLIALLPTALGANGGLKVEGVASGTAVPVSGTVTASNTAGDVAHDTADSGNPVKIGCVAVSGSATPTSVAAGDRVRLIANQHGIPYGLGGHPNLITREFDFGTSAQTDVNLAAAAVAADERIYVTRFEALCDNANTVAVSVRAGFGTANVPAASATGVNGMIASHPGIAAASGILCGNGAGIIAVGGAGEEPRITSSAATSGNLHVVISYFLVDETP